MSSFYELSQAQQEALDVLYRGGGWVWPASRDIHHAYFRALYNRGMAERKKNRSWTYVYRITAAGYQTILGAK